MGDFLGFTRVLSVLAVPDGTSVVDVMSAALGKIVPYIPNLLFIVFVVVVIIFANELTDKAYSSLERNKQASKILTPTSRAFIKALIYVVGSVTILLNIPGVKSDIARFFGLIFGGIVAFSSSTIIANGMAGLLIKIIGKYKTGDLIEAVGKLGRVTEIKTFHTEIQTIRRKLLVIPNHVMISNTFANFSEQGYLVHTTVSLGYDLPRTTVEAILIAAANNVGLEQPFVSVIELGDYSVTYEINGLLRDRPTRNILEGIVPAQSQLNAEILDECAKANVEIVSPMFQNVRQFQSEQQFIAQYKSEESQEELKRARKKVDTLQFPKAKVTAAKENIRDDIQNELHQLAIQEDEITAQIEKAPDDATRDTLQTELDKIQAKKNGLGDRLKQLES